MQAPIRSELRKVAYVPPKLPHHCMSQHTNGWEMEAYRYPLPVECIAQSPLGRRDASKLLVVHSGSGEVEHHVFNELPGILTTIPGTPHLVFNQTKVVAARLYLRKPTGGAVELLLTRPLSPSTDPQVVLGSTASSTWECMIGGKNVRADMVLGDETSTFQARVVERKGAEAIVQLSWQTDEALSQVLDTIGHVPLPPYITRPDDGADKQRYQTVFAKDEGSAAAPTAGLHFTSELLETLRTQNISRSTLTLHVGLGTFKPVDADNAIDHVMHKEDVVIQLAMLDELLQTLNNTAPFIIPVGTTAMRSLESAYWLGVQLLAGRSLEQEPIVVPQFIAFDESLPHARAADAFYALRTWMQEQGLTTLSFQTQLMIAPGARIGVVGGLITNFHQPGSTLLLLVATLLGERWRAVYQEAIDSRYRFLSYGDAMLVIRTHDGETPTT